MGRSRMRLSQFFLLLPLFLLANPILEEDGLFWCEKLKNENRFEEAISSYQKRLDANRPEEVWENQWGLGQCYEALNNWPQALYWYLEAFQSNPLLTDPLVQVTSHYRNEGQNDLAYIFAKHGTRNQTSDYRFEQELSIVAFYTRYREEGYKAISDLLMRKEVPWHVKSNAYQNLVFYCQNLKNTRFQKIEIELPFVTTDSDERFHPMNPSIVKTDDGYLVICRSVNYTQTGARDFHTNDPDGYYRTRNFLLKYDKSFKLLSSKEIVDLSVRERFPSSIVLGQEDCRIFDWDGEFWFTTNTRDTHPSGVPQITLCKLDDGDVTQLIPLIGPDPERCEKNWLPFILDGELHLIYLYDPLTIFKTNPATGYCETILEYMPTHDFSLFRGSAGPIPFDEGYLILVHEPIALKDGNRTYFHRFVYMDHRFMVKQVSKPFTFLHQGVEFCCSMTTDIAEKTLIMTLGIEDAQATLCFVDLNTVRSLLCPLPSN